MRLLCVERVVDFGRVSMDLEDHHGFGMCRRKMESVKTLLLVLGMNDWMIRLLGNDYNLW